MDKVQDILAIWYVKVVFGFFLALFAPIQTSVVITFIMILLDTITGVACAIKLRRFNSRTFKKNFKKVAVYATCLLTIRLVEVGVLDGTSTKIFSQIMAGFLILTEATSILENLTILGLPISNGFLNIIFKQPLEALILNSQQQKKELGEIEDILYYQVPSIKSIILRKILEVKVEILIDVIRDIISYLDGLQKPDNELIYYKVTTVIERGFAKMDKKWVEDGVSEECIETFKKWHRPRIDALMSEVKEVCYRIIPADKKKEELVKKLTILAYKTILDAQKEETSMICETCENK